MSPPPVFDAHLHIIDPRFPLVANQGYLPPAFTCADYLAQTAPLGVVGGAVVSGSFQAFDQGYLIEALRELGPGFVGVTQLSASVKDAEIIALDSAGVRAVRFNVHRGGSAGLADLEWLAARVYALAGWHVELYIDSSDLVSLEARLGRLPALSIDHLGLSRAGYPALLRLVERGVRIKASGFGRVDFDVPQALREIAAISPHALLFGTDLPSTRAPRPFTPADLALLQEALGETLARRALFENAQAFYRPRTGAPT